MRVFTGLDDLRAAVGVALTTNVTVELEGSERPALVAEWVLREYV